MLVAHKKGGKRWFHYGTRIDVPWDHAWPVGEDHNVKSGSSPQPDEPSDCRRFDKRGGVRRPDGEAEVDFLYSDEAWRR